MSERNPSEYLVKALARVNARHRSLSAEAWPGTSPAFTVAVSRTTGALGTSVAREVGQRLGWQVYDHELLEKIAGDMKVRVGLLEDMDEKHVSWIEEVVEAFATAPQVTEIRYVHHLVETLLGLAARGKCVLVGRGAALLLPPARTLRVRLVAPLDVRVTTISRDRGLSREAARQVIEKTDRERARFLKEHFLADSEDPTLYDTTLNVERFSVAECADLIVETLRRLQAPAAKP